MADNSQPATVKFTKGSSILLEGKPNSDRFYIIKEGKVQITRETDAVVREANVAGPGEMLGVISVMASRSYIESVVALTDVSVLAVEKNHISQSTSIAMNIIKQFSQRLRKMNEAFSERVMKSAAPDDPSHLLKIGEYYEKAGKINQALYAYQQYLIYCPNTQHMDNVKKRIEKMKSRSTTARPVFLPNTMIQKWPKNCLLFAEGETGHTLYVIQEGSVKITKIVNNQEAVLAVLKKGDVLGEMAMLEDKPRNATAEIYEDCTLLSINRSNFTNLLNEQPDMVIRLITLMAERIWLLYRQFSHTLIENPLGRIYDALLIQLEKDRVNLDATGPYQCNFGFKELLGMAGIPESQTNEFYNKVYTARRIVINNNNKVQVLNVASILKEAEYYRRARKTGKENKV